MQANNDFSVLFVYQECIVVVALNIVWCACRLAVGIIIAKLQGVSAFVLTISVQVYGYCRWRSPSAGIVVFWYVCCFSIRQSYACRSAVKYV